MKATKANPSDRYQSALEMRRALEAISISGYWTTDARGDYIGISGNQTFRFSHEKASNGYKFTAFRNRLDSGNETRVVKMSGSKLSRAELKRFTREFMLSVVKGDL